MQVDKNQVLFIPKFFWLLYLNKMFKKKTTFIYFPFSVLISNTYMSVDRMNYNITKIYFKSIKF